MIARVDSFDRLPPSLRGGVVAIGNFDGVHRGHQAVLQTARAKADEFEQKFGACPCVALTFEPHPRTLFQPDVVLSRITPADMKAHVLAQLGFDAVVELPFTRAFASQTADEFIDAVLLKGLGARHVVTGFDFHFGKNRQGGPAFLMEQGALAGFKVTLVDAFRDEGAEVISSSRIRQCLQSADLAQANGLLGYRYRVAGNVGKGKQLGRTLGYPTANIQLPDDTALAHGIYAVRFITPDGVIRDGVASFGKRPTVDTDGAPLLETYVFDFNGDLYGSHCTVILCSYLRGELKFDDLDALTVQMKQDEAEARALLADLQPLSPLDAKLTFGAVDG